MPIPSPATAVEPPGAGAVWRNRDRAGLEIPFKTFLLIRTATCEVLPIRMDHNCVLGGGSVMMLCETVGDSLVVSVGAIVEADVPPPVPSVASGARAARGACRRPVGVVAGADDDSRLNYS